MADVGFVAYDVYRIGRDNVFGDCGNLGTNLGALAADTGGALIPFATGGGAAVRASSHLADEAPNRIYSARELARRAEEPGPYHNFPESFNEGIFKGNRREISDDYVLYTNRGAVNGKEGTFEIGVRPSESGRTETITHRFFRPDR